MLKRQHTSIDSSCTAQSETKTDDDYESNKKQCTKLPVTIIDTIKAEPTVPLENCNSNNINKQILELEKTNELNQDFVNESNSCNETASNMELCAIDLNKIDHNKAKPVPSSSPIIKVHGFLHETVETVDQNNNNLDDNDLFKVKVDAYYCKLCYVVLNEDKNIKQHISTVTHKTKLNQNV
jgi:hemerythrin superfamily protein